MPTYEYQCRECGISFERYQHFSEAPLRICPECGGLVRRVIQPVGIIFKGKGFYVTDNRADRPPPTPKPESKERKEESQESEVKSADVKSSTDSATKAD